MGTKTYQRQAGSTRRRDVTTGGTDRWSSGSGYESYVGRWSRLVAPEFLDWLAIPPRRRWLDVGCGSGALTEAILARCDPRSVVGVDPSEAFVAHARATVVDARASFVVGTAAMTGLDDGDVDCVVSGLVLNFVPDVGEALAEAQRLVSPGGVVGGYVWDYVEGMQLMRRFWDAAVALDPAAQASDEGVRFGIAAPGPLAAAFTAAGLEAVDVRPIEVPTVFADFDDFWRPFLGGTGTAPAYAASLTGPARNALRDRLRASVADEPDGSIRLVARAWAAQGRYAVCGRGWWSVAHSPTRLLRAASIAALSTSGLASAASRFIMSRSSVMSGVDATGCLRRPVAPSPGRWCEAIEAPQVGPVQVVIPTTPPPVPVGAAGIA